MRYRDLSTPLRLYLAINVCLMIPAVASAVLFPGRVLDPGIMAVLLIASAVFSTWKVELTVLQGKMTLTFAVSCLAVLLQGQAGAVYCAILGALVGSYFRPDDKLWRIKRVSLPIHRSLFNVGNCAISAAASAGFYSAIRQVGATHQFTDVLALTAFTSSYFLINTLGVSYAIALQRSERWLKVWRENFLWTAPGFFASGTIAVAVQFLWGFMNIWSLAFLPWLWVIYKSYRIYTDKLTEEKNHVEKLNALNEAIIASLATAIDAKDRNTSSHINRVRRYAKALALAAGVEEKILQAVETGAVVHDIGKLGIPDHILLKPGKLGSEEFKRMQSHVTIGAEILSQVPFDFPVVDVVLSHHERWDGRGYPNGLKGEDIPIGGRIIAIVDVFDALTSNRPYRRAMSCDEAMEILSEGAGKQFDPALVQCFLKVLPELWPQVEAEEVENRRQVAERALEPDRPPSALVQIGQAAAEMAAVCGVAEALAEQESLDSILTVIADRVLSLVPADCVALYLLDDDRKQLHAVRCAGKFGERLQGMTIEVGEGLAGSIAATGVARFGVSALPDVSRRFAPDENVELSSAAAVPVAHGTERLGVLAVYTTAYGILGEHHFRILSVVAEHAAAAIQNLRRFEEHRELAFTDPLTGLANSRCLFRQLDRLVLALDSDGKSREAEQFGLVMLDLDGFKAVNDRLGHLRGDDLLRTIASNLLQIARTDDLVCRYAGDEFVVLIPRAGRDQAERVANRVRTTIDRLGLVDGKVVIGASVGAASYPVDGVDARALIHMADCRMYEDKLRRRQSRQRVNPTTLAAPPFESVRSVSN